MFVQKDAGFGSGFFDQDYKDVGATIVEAIQDVYASSEMIVKVKEPIEEEYPLITSNHVVFYLLSFCI